MDVVIGKVWFALKGFVAVVASVSGIVVIVGIECKVDSSVTKIVLGSSMILSAIFIMADFGGLKQALDRLHTENSRLATNNEHLEQSLAVQKEQLAQSEKQISRRDAQLGESELQLSKLENELNDLHAEREELSAQVKKLEQYMSSMESSLNESKAQIVQREQQLQEGKIAIDRMESVLAKQKLIQDNANKLIQSLMSVGDDFKDFKSVIQESLKRIDNTADMLDVLATRMTGAKFVELDADGDGAVTQSELVAWIKKQSV